MIYRFNVNKKKFNKTEIFEQLLEEFVVFFRGLGSSKRVSVFWSLTKTDSVGPDSTFHQNMSVYLEHI
jgi:hypothetical protein